MALELDVNGKRELKAHSDIDLLCDAKSKNRYLPDISDETQEQTFCHLCLTGIACFF